MNAALGARIRSLREAKGKTQEEVAASMNCSRQRLARLEKGLVDVSFSSISSVALVLGVEIEEITSVIKAKPRETPLYRGGNGTQHNDGYEIIEKMLDVFYAHRKLYNSVKQVEEDE